MEGGEVCSTSETDGIPLLRNDDFSHRVRLEQTAYCVRTVIVPSAFGV